MIIKCGQDISIDQCHLPNHEKKKKKKEHWCLIFNYLSSLTCGKEAQDGMRVFRKGRKMDSLFLVFMENRKRVGQAHWRIRIAETSWKHLADLTAPLSVLLLMSWLNAYFSISASLSSCLNFCIIWNFGQLTITFIFMLTTFSNTHFNKFFIIIHFI